MKHLSSTSQHAEILIEYVRHSVGAKKNLHVSDKPRWCIKKQRHHFAIKVHLVKAMVFPVVIYGCDIEG